MGEERDVRPERALHLKLRQELGEGSRSLGCTSIYQSLAITGTVRRRHCLGYACQELITSQKRPAPGTTKVHMTAVPV